MVRNGMLPDRLAGRTVTAKTHVIANGISAVRKPPAPADIASCARLRDLLAFCQKGRTIGFVGRLSREKGIDTLLLAFARLCSTYQDVVLALVGDGPLRVDLLQLCTRLAIEIVFFLLVSFRLLRTFYRSLIYLQYLRFRKDYR